MSEELSFSAGSVKVEDYKGSCLRDSCCSDGDTANELFNSFMEIVNDPEYQDKQADQLHGMVDRNDQEHEMLPSRTHDQNEESNKDSKADDSTLLITEATYANNDADKQESSTNNSNSEKVDSGSVESKSNAATDQVNVEPSQLERGKGIEEEDSSKATGINLNLDSRKTFTIEKPGGSEDQDTNASNGSVAPSGNEVLSDNEAQPGIEADKQMEGNVKSSESETDVKDDSNLGHEAKGDVPIKHPVSMQADKETRWTRAMEHLEGLEQLLFSAVAEFQRSNSIKDKEADKQWVATSDGETNLVCESEHQDSIVSSRNAKEIEPQQIEENVNKLSKNNGANSVEKEERLQNTPSMSNTAVEVTNHEPNNLKIDLSTEYPCNLNEREQTLQPADTLCESNSEVQIEPVVSDAKNIEGGSSTVVEQSENVANSASLDDELQNTKTDRVVINEMASTQELIVDSVSQQAVPSLEKSDSEADELDLEVAKACMPVPDIEIVTTDESGISERKSLDSIDTEESSNSRAASPAFSDEGIDSDVQSDCGDDDEETCFDHDTLENVRRKSSWLLERDRSRLSSDSSTVSEKEFKERFTRGDNADGNPCKDRIRGHLLKMGGTGLTPKNWRKRWFVLGQDNCLYYYKHSKDKEPCGVIVLCNYSVSKAPEVNKRHCMKLTKGGARTYYMCAGSEDDRRQWMLVLMEAVKDSAVELNPFHVSEGNLHNVSIPALSIRDPECHGYLYKQGHNIKTWRRRYFVLKSGFLYYYSDMSNTVALGVAKLHGYAIEEGTQNGKKFSFSAISPDSSSRTYYFAADSEMDRKRWLSRLEKSVKRSSLCF